MKGTNDMELCETCKKELCDKNIEIKKRKPSDNTLY